MMNLQGSWVAMPTPFTEDNQVDIEGFKLLIARQIKYGTNQLFILGSAGEVTLLSIEEKKLIVKSVIAYMKDRAARGLRSSPCSSAQHPLPPRQAWSLHSSVRMKVPTASCSRFLPTS